MMSRARLALLVTGSALLLAGVAQGAPRLPPGDLALGANAEGQACRAVDRFDGGRGVRAYDLYCGDWPRPSGRLGRYESRAGEAIAAAQKRLCPGARTPVTAAGFDELTQIACQGGVGGQPGRFGLVARIGDATIVGDGFPADWPALVTGARVLGRLQARTAAAPSSGETPGLRAIQAAFPAGPPGQAAVANYELLRRRAYEYNVMWSFATAERDLQELLRAHAATAPDDAAGEADILAEIGLNLSNARRFAEAEDAFERAERRGAEDGLLRSKVANYRAVDALNRRRWSDALRLADAADALRAALAAEARGGVRLTSADVNRVEGRARAQERRNLLAPLNEITPEQRSAILSAQAAYVAAVAEGQLGRTEAADARLEAARAWLETVNAPPGWLVAQIADRSALVKLARGDMRGARNAVVEGLELIRAVAPGTRGEGHLWLTKARVESTAGARDVALADGRTAVALFARQLEQPGMPPDVAAVHLSTLYDAWAVARDPALAAEYFETLALVWDGAAAKSAAQLAARLSLGEGGGPARAYQDAERAYRAAIARRRQLAEDPGAEPEQLEDADGEVEGAAAAYAASETALRSAAPRYLELLSPRIAAADLTSALTSAEAYVRVVVGSSGSWAAVATPAGIVPVKLSLTEAQADSLTARMLASVAASERRGLPAFDLEAAQALHAALLAPMLPLLDGVTRVQLDTGGPIAALPFAALVEAAPTGEAAERAAGEDYTGVTFAGRRHAFAKPLGPASFMRLRRTSSVGVTGQLDAALFGDFTPDPRGVTERLVQANRLSASCRVRVEAALRRLGRLEASVGETRTVARAFGDRARLRLAADFTDSDFMTSEAVGEADVLLLSTHGVLNLSDCFPEPALLTSLGAEGTGLIEASELLDRRLSARLVVLSACDTAGGAAIDVARTGLTDGGEALSGLARGFLYAGAANVMATAWSVDAATIADQVTGVLADAARSQPLADVLRDVQQRIAADPETSHPFYWAPFLLIGDGGVTLATGAPAIT